MALSSYTPHKTPLLEKKASTEIRSEQKQNFGNKSSDCFYYRILNWLLTHNVTI